MGLIIGDNFDFKGRKALDNRLVVDDLAALLSFPENVLYDGIKTYVRSEKKYYIFDSRNDSTELGKWIDEDTVDLSNYATKEDLKNVEVDLSDYASLNDLKKYTTKEELRELLNNGSFEKELTNEECKSFIDNLWNKNSNET